MVAVESAYLVHQQRQAYFRRAQATAARDLFSQLGIKPDAWPNFVELSARHREAQRTLAINERRAEAVPESVRKAGLKSAMSNALFLAGQAHAWALRRELLLVLAPPRKRNQNDTWELRYRRRDKTTAPAKNIYEFRAEVFSARVRAERKRLGADSRHVLRSLGLGDEALIYARDFKHGFNTAIHRMRELNRDIYQAARKHRGGEWGPVRDEVHEIIRERKRVTPAQVRSAVERAEILLALRDSQDVMALWDSRRATVIDGIARIGGESELLRRVHGSMPAEPLKWIEALATSALDGVEALPNEMLDSVPSSVEMQKLQAAFASDQSEVAGQFVATLDEEGTVSFATLKQVLEATARQQKVMRDSVVRMRELGAHDAVAFATTVAKQRAGRITGSALDRVAYRFASLVGEELAYTDKSLWLEILPPSPNGLPESWRVVRTLPDGSIVELERANEAAFRRLKIHAEVVPDEDEEPIVRPGDPRRAIASESGFIADFPARDEKTKAAPYDRLLDDHVEVLVSELNGRVGRELIERAMRDGYDKALTAMRIANREVLEVWHRSETNVQMSKTEFKDTQRTRRANKAGASQVRSRYGQTIGRREWKLMRLESGGKGSEFVRELPIQRDPWDRVKRRLTGALASKAPVRINKQAFDQARAYVLGQADLDELGTTVALLRTDIEDRRQRVTAAIADSPLRAEIEDLFGAIHDGVNMPDYVDRLFEAATAGPNVEAGLQPIFAVS